ncbi:ATPase inhibitor subunit zeta [Loktanella sp. S4079]|uniref:ATPase inhibitor subunit zeta n=1 Tax=Loktanella sp. S4079 TaxID=579483 RepID=UPI0005FA07DB|nr:ATPase inhibitor subunit zeta [Loktanella sp. S4079]KJZ20050.1 hypothetical protein TW80_04175 [Loktanella sp. S4079]
MNTFEDRERAAEAKFAHDAEQQFQQRAHKISQIATWAAQLRKLSYDETKAYTVELRKLSLQAPTQDAFVSKLCSDLEGLVGKSEILERMQPLLGAHAAK